MDVVDLPLEQIIPYARNPRRNDEAVATVAASIAEFGWRQPIVSWQAKACMTYNKRKFADEAKTVSFINTST